MVQQRRYFEGENQVPSFKKPSTETLQRFLHAEEEFDFTYDAVGATATTPPAGFVVDHTRIQLGEGEAVFLAAQVAIRQWDQFRLGWVETYPANLSIEPGKVVAVMGHAVGIWWLS